MAKSTKQKTDFLPKSEEEAVAVCKTRLQLSEGFAEKNFNKSAKRNREMFKGDHWKGDKSMDDKNDRVVVRKNGQIRIGFLGNMFKKYKVPGLRVLR